MQKQVSTEMYDERLHLFFRKEASISLEEKKIFTIYPSGKMDHILLSTAIRNHYRIYEHINQGIVSGKIGRMTKEDLRRIGAVQFDFEYAVNKEKSYAASEDAYNEFLKRKIIHFGQAMQKGAGGKIIIPIPLIFCRDAEQSLAFEAAWYQVRTRLNKEIMDPIAKRYDINFKLDTCPLSGLAAAHGTFRPYNPKKHDDNIFENGMLRTIEYSDGKIHPSSVLQAMLLEAKEHPIKSTKEHIKDQKQSIDLLQEAELSMQKKLIRNFIRSRQGTSDDVFYSCINMLTKYCGDEEAIKFAEIVNAEADWPYKTKERAAYAAQDIISRFKNYTNVENQHKTIEKPSRTLKVDVNRDDAQLLALWIEQNLRKSEDGKLSVRNAYECYFSWVQLKGKEPISDHQFFRIMKDSGFEPIRSTINKEKAYRYHGVELNVRIISSVA